MTMKISSVSPDFPGERVPKSKDYEKLYINGLKNIIHIPTQYIFLHANIGECRVLVFLNKILY